MKVWCTRDIGAFWYSKGNSCGRARTDAGAVAYAENFHGGVSFSSM